MLVVATVGALAIAVLASIRALRAGRRAAQAAEQVAQLLEPEVVVSIPATAGEPVVSSTASAASTAAPTGDGATDRGDPNHPRIPVLDLDRLRAWLTDPSVRLGRITVVSVELDNLQQVNERLGHHSGAQLLEAITQRLRAVTRPRDVVAHVNQERFVLVCRDVPDRAAAEALAERVALGVAHPSVLSDGIAEVTASIGVALAVEPDERAESVLRRAIRAGNHARASGGARIEISADVAGRVITDAEFAAALTKDEFVVHYLPIVSCTTGRIAGFESLVRWEHPERGLLLPSEFLPQAERNGAVLAVGARAIELACTQMAAWHERSAPALKLNVNFSARELVEPTFPSHVGGLIAAAGLAPGSVWLEISEATLLADRGAAAEGLHRLREVGARLVIDDFGAGGASLVSLKQYPVDAIKIDRAFVAELGRSRDGDAVCGAILELAHELGLGVIAEGVETVEQWQALRRLGCELAQGRLFGPPRPAAEYGDHPANTLGLAPDSA